jgi:hypothetical protein
MDRHGSVSASRYARINQSSAERAGSLTVNAAAFPVQIGLGSVLFWILLCHNPYVLKRPFSCKFAFRFQRDRRNDLRRLSEQQWRRFRGFGRFKRLSPQIDVQHPF